MTDMLSVVARAMSEARQELEWLCESDRALTAFLPDAKAFIKALEAQGLVIVPREPTEAMLQATEKEWDGRMSFRSTGAWQAMLAALEGKP